MMRFYVLLGGLALALAAPLLSNASDLVGTTANEFTRGGCRDAILLFARGSMQAGNLGATVGLGTARGIKRRLGPGRVAVEGLEYAALLQNNLFPGGTTVESAKNMSQLIGNATTKCPKAKLLLGGYSQGAAVIHRAMELVAEDDKKHIAAILTFGDTQTFQDGGRVPGFPQGRTKIICNPGDLVCNGTLIVTPAHMDYEKHVGEGVEFLAKWAKEPRQP